MAKLFNLEIFTPERVFFKGEVESMIINTDSGEMGILYHTLPIVTILSEGVMKIFQNNKWMEAVNAGGFVSVSRNVVTVLAEYAAWPHEIDIKKVSEEISLLDEQQRRARSYSEYKMAKAQLAVQFAKLKVKKRDI